MSDSDINKLILSMLTKQGSINEEQTKALESINACLIRQEESLKYHIKRTDLLEDSVELLRDEFKPVKRHVDLINSGAKILVTAVGVVAGIVAILKYIW